ncbi:hypothetical protein KWI13_24565, partial [Enterobacter cloacae]|nr:hypothetical protein [Enterobacter cloacae]
MFSSFFLSSSSSPPLFFFSFPPLLPPLPSSLSSPLPPFSLPFAVVLASPAAMRVVGQLGPVLGPRGLMPPPPVGTFPPPVAAAVPNATAGPVRYRPDKNGLIHTTIGKV